MARVWPHASWREGSAAAWRCFRSGPCVECPAWACGVPARGRGVFAMCGRVSEVVSRFPLPWWRLLGRVRVECPV